MEATNPSSSEATMQQAIQSAMHPPVLRLLAKFSSWIFHPIFVPLYVTWFLVYVHPSFFAGFSMESRNRVLMLIALNAVFFPLVTVLLLRALKFIDSIYLRTQRDRIIPYVASMTFFFWTQYVLREQTLIPRVLVSFMFGVFIASAASLIANIYQKVSMHTVGMGGLVGILVVIAWRNPESIPVPLAIATIIAGWIGTARLLVSDHTSSEIRLGYLIGFVCQLAGAVMFSW